MSTISSAALALAFLPQHAGTTQWREVAAPTVAPIEALALSPTASGRLITSVRATPESIYRLGGNAWSVDQGASWEQTYGLKVPVLFDIATHPTDPDVMWGAAFEAWKSTDGGLSWTRKYQHANTIAAIAVDPSSPNRVYACGRAYSPAGTFHLSTDGGDTWHSTSPMPFIDHSDVAVLAQSSGVGVVLLASSPGIHRSTDGGLSFSSVQVGVTGRKLATAAQNPLVAWCIATNTNGKTRLWRSIDAGVSWTKVTTPVGDMNDVVAHPSDPARALVVTTKFGARYTQDGGSTWLPVAGLSPTVDLHSVAWSATSPELLFAGDRSGSSGAWRSLDSGLSWERSSAGLKTGIPLLRFDGAGAVFGAGLGVPLRLDDPEGTWLALEHSLGAPATVSSLSVHPSDPNTLAWVNARPAWNEFNQVVVSADAGATWATVTPPNAQSTTFEVLEVAFDADGTLHAASQFGDLHSSPDLGVTWTTVSPQPPWYVLREFVPDPYDAERMFATDERTFFRSVDRGQTWVRRPIGAETEREPVDLAVSPADPSVLYVLVGQIEKALYRSADAGDTWVAFGAGLPEAGVTRLAVDPSNAARMLVGTKHVGVYLSTDGGASFLPWSAGIEHTHVLSVAFDPAHSGRAWLSTAQGELFVLDF